MTYSIETETCSRCAGTGRCGPIVVYRGICFKCDGSGKQYTRAGAKVRALYDAACKLPIAELTVGQKIIEMGITHAAQPYFFTTTVETIERNAPYTAYTYKDALTGESARHQTMDSEEYPPTFQPALSREEKSAILASFAPKAGLLLDGQPTKPGKRLSDEEKEARRVARTVARRERKLAEPASEKQIALIDRLLAERGSSRSRDLTKVEASSAIDHFFNRS